MTTGTIIFTLAHFALFIYTRIRYVRKYKKAVAEKAKVEIENLQLQSKLRTYEAIVNGYESQDE